MKIREICRKHKKKIIIITISLVMVLVIVGVTVFYYLRRNSGTGMPFFTGGSSMGGMNSTNSMVSAYGVTGIGMTEESFEVEGLETKLLIEEVYLSSDTQVEEGTAVLKLSEESVKEAREELESILHKADLAYRTGVITCEQNKITAQYERDAAVLEGQQAKEVYTETIASLESAVKQASEALEEAKEQIAEYQAAVDGDTFDEDYKVTYYKELYEENLDLLKQKLSDWGVDWSQVITSSGAGTSGNTDSSGNSSEGMGGISSLSYEGSGTISLADESSQRMNMVFHNTSSVSLGLNTSTVSGGDNTNSPEHSEQNNESLNNSNQEASDQQSSTTYVSILKNLYGVLEQNLKDYDQALSEYEEAKANTVFELQTLELNLPSLEKAVIQAQENYETKILEAKLAYETSLSGAEQAERDYETAIQKALADLEELKDAREDAQKNLKLFESSVGDGYYYAAGTGTVLRMMLRSEQYLTSESVIFIYSNPEELTVTVSVDQSDISQVELGDTAYIESTEYGSFQGTVTQINPVSSSDSRTSVTYQVTVSVPVSGDTQSLSANQTVTVIFGLGEVADE